MAKHTIRDKLIAGLQGLGFVVVPSRSSKYVTLTCDDMTPRYVGKSGAYRFGNTATDSQAMPEAIKSWVIRYGDELLRNPTYTDEQKAECWRSICGGKATI